jgi:hypothetical protein
MEEITVKGQRRGLWIAGAINLALVGYNGWHWLQGEIGPNTKMLTIVPGALLLLKVFFLSKPIYLRLSGGRFFARMGFVEVSTTPENVSNLDYVDGKARIVFQDLGKVDASKGFQQFMETNFRNRGRHLEFPLGTDLETFERLRQATLKDRA